MCGRFSIYAEQAEIERRFHAEFAAAAYAKRYNAAPGMNLPVVTNAAPNRIELFHWGLIPSWAKEKSIGYKMINARAETLDVKPSYRTAYAKRRCLVIADGFYEWKKSGNTKQPFRIGIGGGLMAFAGLWETWADEDGCVIHSFTIITTSANELMKDIHDRMPVILSADDEEAWLTRGYREVKGDLLAPYPAGSMDAYPVSTLVNSPRNDGEEVVRRTNK